MYACGVYVSAHTCVRVRVCGVSVTTFTTMFTQTVCPYAAIFYDIDNARPEVYMCLIGKIAEFRNKISAHFQSVRHRGTDSRTLLIFISLNGADKVDEIQSCFGEF